MKSHEEQTPPAKQPRMDRREEQRAGGYRYYLEDHPYLGPVITLLLGGLCIYSTIFSTLLRDIVVGAGANRTSLDNFYTATGWMVAFVLGIMGIALVFLLINLAELGLRRARRRPAVCPRCGTAETRALRFTHEPVHGTGWEIVHCPNCDHEWHNRR